MSVSLTPSKRQRDDSLTEPDGKGNRRNQPSMNSSGSVFFRVLCPASKVDCLIGEGSSLVSQIQQETGVELRVEEAIPDCDERVFVIGFEKEGDGAGEEEQEEEAKDDCETKEEEDKRISSLKKAMVLVVERMIEEHRETDGGDEKSKKSSPFVLRLLVLSTQVGCILGKGGCVIKQMASDSGAQIRILPRDKLPPCASSLDELVQITGEVEAVRKALNFVSLQLLGNPLRDHDVFSTNVTAPSSHLFDQPRPRPEAFPSSNRSFSAQGAPYADGPRDVDFHSSAPPLVPKFHDGFHSRMKPALEILTFRILCPAERVGAVIGKGGTIIKAIQQDTGCEVKVIEEGMSGSQDRVIAVSGHVHPDDRVSAVQDAFLRVQSRIVRAAPDSKEQSVTARLLISSNQIGCLLGKGGSIITEMRKLSRAHIRIWGKDQIPNCALEDEEVVQISGEFESVQDALIQISTRLQHNFFRDAFPSINHPTNPALFDPPFLPYLGPRELSPPGMHSNYGPSFHKFDLHRHGGFQPRDDRVPFMHDFHRFGGPTLSERRPWGPQRLLEGGGPGLPDFGRFPERERVGQSAVVSSTTVEVVVPHSVVPAIYGEDGECLKQIRQISDANITIMEPEAGAVETVIIISGIPEQTHAAQSLIQAFVISETEST
ncbi:RNA-binding KH domain-containing protein RCF3-like [Humulus lupulus]|uniref:RNA-binding KH domain-containing protein RCF3-like n=1 Tax=Humulus lupulus TaxID=3486 RepID=UPI002B406FCA|nr:RNA-binding KH domain-containing protein RCF3-like [Humulus lupulus]